MGLSRKPIKKPAYLFRENFEKNDFHLSCAQDINHLRRNNWILIPNKTENGFETDLVRNGAEHQYLFGELLTQEGLGFYFPSSLISSGKQEVETNKFDYLNALKSSYNQFVCGYGENIFNYTCIDNTGQIAKTFSSCNIDFQDHEYIIDSSSYSFYHERGGNSFKIPGVITTRFVVNSEGLVFKKVKASNSILEKYITDMSWPSKIAEADVRQAEKEEYALLIASLFESKDLVAKSIAKNILKEINKVLSNKSLLILLNKELKDTAPYQQTEFCESYLSNILTYVCQILEDPRDELSAITLRLLLKRLKKMSNPAIKNLEVAIEAFTPNRITYSLALFLQDDHAAKNIIQENLQGQRDDFARVFNDIINPGTTLSFIKPLLTTLQNILSKSSDQLHSEILKQWIDCVYFLATEELFDSTNTAQYGIRQDIYEQLNIDNKLSLAIQARGIDQIKAELLNSFWLLLGDDPQVILQKYDTSQGIAPLINDTSGKSEEDYQKKSLFLVFSNLARERAFLVANDPKTIDTIKDDYSHLQKKDFQIQQWLKLQHRHKRFSAPENKEEFHFYEEARNLQIIQQNMDDNDFRKKPTRVLLEETLKLKDTSTSNVEINALTKRLQKNQTLLKVPSVANSQEYLADANNLMKNTKTKRLAGAMLGVLGAIVLAASIATAVALFPFGAIPSLLGLVVADALLVGGFGLLGTMTSGIGLFNLFRGVKDPAFKSGKSIEEVVTLGTQMRI